MYKEVSNKKKVLKKQQRIGEKDRKRFRCFFFSQKNMAEDEAATAKKKKGFELQK
jgi:hypothetical protein